LFAWAASPNREAKNSNNAKDGTYPSKREAQRAICGTLPAKARLVKETDSSLAKENSEFRIPNSEF